MGESSESNAPFKFEIKGAPNAEATTLGGGSDVEDAAGNPPLQAFRFKLKTRDGFAQPAVIAVAQPRTHAKVQTGTLTVKGALAGEAFFLLNARTHQPVKVSEGSKVKTTTTVASGVMFILGRDRTATFEKLPAGHYQVVFPPEQTEGAKHEQPQIKANAHGAHVVDIKDFVHKGAICEIEVPPGGTPTLELTLSADGTAQVCCQEKAMCDTQEHIGIGQTAAGYIPDLLRNIDGAQGLRQLPQLALAHLQAAAAGLPQAEQRRIGLLRRHPRHGRRLLPRVRADGWLRVEP